MDNNNLRQFEHRSSTERTPCDLCAELFGGPIRPIRRDQFGEPLDDPTFPSNDGKVAIHGQHPPTLPRTARIERIRRLSPVERTDAEAAYIEVYDVLDAFPNQAGEVERAISDWRAAL